ncbi:MAG: sigma 54-interacting transcriptional regulator [Blastocatellia bacterium]
MNLPDLNLPESLQADAAAGTLHFKKRRLLLLDANFLGLLRKKLVAVYGLPQAREIMSYLGYASGYQAALMVQELCGPERKEKLWQAWAQLYAQQGFAAVRPLSCTFDEKTHSFAAEAEFFNSCEVEQHLLHLGPSDQSVCWTLTTYATGFASALMGREVIFIEKECVGRGDARCYITGRTDFMQWSEGVEFAREYYKGQDFEAVRLWTRTMTAEARELIHALEHERERVRALESQVYYLQEASREQYRLSEMVGAHPAFQKVLRQARTVAASDATALIQGETGTGKELIARFIHTQSERGRRPLITVNCAALPAGLVESELFGHEKGAFTGAVGRKLGRFEIAHGATIFLDEVGELPLEAQAKFLRVLQQGEFERVGGAHTIRTDVRVLAATNQPLQKLVDEGKFRADLFYRLNVFPLSLPPLRERGNDLILLVNYFAQKYRARFRKQITSVSLSSLESLKQYHWPGNVRELEHIVERAVLLSEGEVLTIDPPLGQSQILSPLPGARADQFVSLEEMERRYIEAVVQHTKGVIAGKGGAAEILDINASTLRSRMKKLGLL